MILSYEHRFAFIKSIKTGSTSVEVSLSRLVGRHDILTYLPPADEAMRREFSGLSEQNNFYEDPNFLRRMLSFGRRNRRLRIHHHNTTALSLSELLGKDIWLQIRSASIIRNPFDRAISKFYHDHHHLTKGSANEAQPVAVINDHLLNLGYQDLTNWHIYSDGTKPLVSRLLRYEDLANEFCIFVRELGFDAPVPLPSAKGNWRPDRRSYREIIGSELRSRIECSAEKELNYGNYTW